MYAFLLEVGWLDSETKARRYAFEGVVCKTFKQAIEAVEKKRPGCSIERVKRKCVVTIIAHDPPWENKS